MSTTPPTIFTSNKENGVEYWTGQDFTPNGVDEITTQPVVGGGTSGTVLQDMGAVGKLVWSGPGEPPNGVAGGLQGDDTVIEFSVSLEDFPGFSQFMQIYYNTVLATVNFPNLADLSGDQCGMSVQDNDALTEVNLPVLADLSGEYASLTLYATSIISSFTLPALANLSGNGVQIYVQENPNLTNFSMPVLAKITGTGIVLYFNINALTTSCVNAILSQLVSTLGTSANNGNAVDLSGQTPAAPPTGPIGSNQIDASGAGLLYAQGDTFVVTGGNGDATGTITAVDGVTGAVTAYTIDNFGTGYSTASDVATTTDSVAGSGFALDITNTADVAALIAGGWTVTTD